MFKVCIKIQPLHYTVHYCSMFVDDCKSNLMVLSKTHSLSLTSVQTNTEQIHTYRNTIKPDKRTNNIIITILQSKCFEIFGVTLIVAEEISNNVTNKDRIFWIRIYITLTCEFNLVGDFWKWKYLLFCLKLIAINCWW